MSGTRVWPRKPAGTPAGGEFAQEQHAPAPLPPPAAAPTIVRSPVAATAEELAAINAPYDTLRPPYPQFSAQVIDFWATADLRDDDLAQMAAICDYHGVHRSYAEQLLRASWASKDGLTMRDRDHGVTDDARILWGHRWSLPDGRALTLNEINKEFPFTKKVRDSGLGFAVELSKPATVVADGLSVYVDGLVQTTSGDSSMVADRIDRDARRRRFDELNGG